mgnify:CR=1 FL=1
MNIFQNQIIQLHKNNTLKDSIFKIELERTKFTEKTCQFNGFLALIEN